MFAITKNIKVLFNDPGQLVVICNFSDLIHMISVLRFILLLSFEA